MPKIPDDILQADAQGKIPEDANVSLAYLAESRDYEAIVGMVTIMIISLLIVLLRVFARIKQLRIFGADDLLALGCIPFYISMVVLGVILINLGSGRHYAYIRYVVPLSVVNESQVLDVAARIMYITALVICRGSVLAFYTRLASKHYRMRYMIWSTTAFIIAAFITQLFLIVLHCNPVTGLWPYQWQPEYEEYDCLNWGNIYISSAAVSIACDLALLAIPIWLLYLLQMHRKKKLLLSLILLPGIGVLVLSTARIYLIYIGTFKPDFSWYYNPQLVVESSEVGGTLIALCFPGLKPLVGKWGSRIAALLPNSMFASEDVGIEISSPECDMASSRLPNNDEEIFELPKSATNGSTLFFGTEHLSELHR